MTTQRNFTFADVLHLAADLFLTPTTGHGFPKCRLEYSCNCIDYAFQELAGGMQSSRPKECIVRDWYMDNFLNPAQKGFEFRLFWDSPESQALRYAQLKFAALIAEEEGL